MDVWQQQRSVQWPWRSVAVVGLAVLGLGGLMGWRLWQQQLAQEQAAQMALSAPAITTVTALGRLEPEGEVITLSAPTATQESRLDQLLIAAGDVVEAGQVIAVLDSAGPRSAALLQVQEQVAIAQAQLAQVQAGAQTGAIQAQQAEIARLEADLVGQENTQRAAIARLSAEADNARLDYQRYESLHRAGAISVAERDARQLTYTTAQRQRQEAEAALARTQATVQQQITQARANLDRLSEVRPVDVSAAQAQVQAALAGMSRAEADLDQTQVRSPRAGQILEIHTQPGETIGPQGIATLGQTQQMMAVAEIYQNDIAQVQPGQRATLISAALAEPLQGTVERLGLQVGQQRVVDEDPAANLDARVVEAYLRLDATSSQRVAGLTNLQVTVTIETGN